MIVSMQNELCLELENANFTAKIIESPKAQGNILIPRFVNYDSKDYIITAISQKSFYNNKQIKSIDFSNDSQLQTIEKNAFAFSSLEKLSIPQTVNELKDGWCCETSKLINISISPRNQHYECLDNKIIITKSNDDSNASIVFARRDIQSIYVPSFINAIAPYAFQHCKQLRNVKFTQKSNVEVIDRYAFSGCTQIERITIPNKVVQVGCYSFSHCEKLKNVTFSKNSNLVSIEKFAFAFTSLATFLIQSNVKTVGEFTFYKCQNLKSVKFDKNAQITKIEKGLFSHSSIESIKVPNSVTIIDAYSFHCCEQLKTVKFCQNSMLCAINKNAFYRSSIEIINVPPLVSCISECCFCDCKSLKTISFASNTELSMIDEEAFAGSSIESISIPCSVKQIGKSCFAHCEQLKTVEFSKGSQLEAICEHAFYFSSIEMISIPETIKFVGKFAFSYCEKLMAFQFYQNEECYIDKDAFEGTFIEKITNQEIASNCESDEFILEYDEFSDNSNIYDDKYMNYSIVSNVNKEMLNVLNGIFIEYNEDIQIVLNENQVMFLRILQRHNEEMNVRKLDYY